MERAALAQRIDATWDWDELRRTCGRDLRRLLGDSHAAEDAVQEALVRAWRNRHKCRHADAPAPWVRRIARNEALRAVSRNHESREPGGLGEERPAAGCLEEQVLSRLSVEQLLGRLSRPIGSSCASAMSRIWPIRPSPTGLEFPRRPLGSAFIGCENA